MAPRLLGQACTVLVGPRGRGVRALPDAGGRTVPGGRRRVDVRRGPPGAGAGTARRGAGEAGPRAGEQAGPAAPVTPLHADVGARSKAGVIPEIIGAPARFRPLGE